MQTQEKLPKGWQWVRCQDVIDVRDGTHDTPKYIPQGVPLVTSKNLKQGIIDFSDVFYISQQDHEEIQKRSRVDKGDIIMAMIGTIGNPVIVNKKREFSIKNVALFKFGNSQVFNQYFYYLLHSSLLVKQLSRESLGVTQKFVSLQVLRDLQIPLPPPEEQKRIASIAQKCDRLRRTRRYTQQLSDSYLRSVFLEMFGDPVVNPMGWDKEQLGDLCRIRRGASPRPIDDYLGGTVPWIKIGDGAKGDSLYLSSTKDFVTEQGANKSVYLEPGSLIFANCGVSLGFARILTISGCIHDGWLAFDQLSKNLNQIFLLRTLNQLTLHFRSLAPDGTQPNLNTGIMGSFPMILPPLPLQEKFAQIVQRFERLRMQQREGDRQAEHLFQTVLHRAFRGEL